MLVERTADGVVTVRYQDAEDVEGVAWVRVSPERAGEGVLLELNRPNGGRCLTTHLTDYDVLAVQAALGLSNVPPPPT